MKPCTDKFIAKKFSRRFGRDVFTIDVRADGPRPPPSFLEIENAREKVEELFKNRNAQKHGRPGKPSDLSLRDLSDRYLAHL